MVGLVIDLKSFPNRFNEFLSLMLTLAVLFCFLSSSILMVSGLIEPSRSEGMGYFHEDFEMYEVGKHPINWTISNYEYWSIDRRSGNKFYTVTGPPTWTISYIKLPLYADINVRLRFMLLNRAPQTAGWLGFVIRGSYENQIRGRWNGYCIVVQHVFLDIRVDNVKSIAKYVYLDIKPNRWYWLSANMEGNVLTIYFSEDGNRYRKLVKVIDNSYSFGDMFALIADPSGFKIAFDDITLSYKPPNPSYPEDKWERIWYTYDPRTNKLTEYLGYGSHEYNILFDNIWETNPRFKLEDKIAYGRKDNIGFVSSRTVYFPSGRWLFIIGSDDGVQFYLDGKLIIDDWHPHAYRLHSFEVKFSTPGKHRLLLRYFENIGYARITFVFLRLHEVDEVKPLSRAPSIFLLKTREHGVFSEPARVVNELSSLLRGYYFSDVHVIDMDGFRRLLKEQPENIVIINTHGELVPIPEEFINSSEPDLRFLVKLRDLMAEHGWIWINLAMYPFYYLGNARHAGERGWDDYGAYLIGELGLSIILGDISATAWTETDMAYISQEGKHLSQEFNLHLPVSIKNPRMIMSRMKPAFSIYSNKEWNAVAAYRIGRGFFVNSYAEGYIPTMVLASLLRLLDKLNFTMVKMENAIGESVGTGWHPKYSEVNITIRGLEVVDGAIFLKVRDGLTRYKLRGWLVDGELKPPSVTLSIMIKKHLTIRPVWRIQHYVNVSSRHGKVIGSGWYDHGAKATISIPKDVIYSGDDIRHIFAGWQGDYVGNEKRFSITVTKPLSMIANWRTEYLVQVDIKPAMLISKIPLEHNRMWVEKGESISIKVPKEVLILSNNTKYVFLCWQAGIEGCDEFNPELKLKVLEPIFIKAVYEPWYYVDVESRYGSISGRGWYRNGSIAHISVSPSVIGFPIKHVFEGWSKRGVMVSRNATYSLIVNGPVELRAIWRDDFSIAITMISVLVCATIFFAIVLKRYWTAEKIRYQAELEKIDKQLRILDELYKDGKISEVAYRRLRREYEEKKRKYQK